MATKEAKPTDQMLVKDIKDRLQARRWVLERNWWGSILYHMGHQWVTYNNNARRWQQRKLSPSVPTPVTNLFRATLDTVKSAIAQHEPRFLGTPTRDDPRSVAAAGSVDAHLKVILKEGRFKTARRRMLDWLVLTGNAFEEIIWDDSEETGLDALPMEQCQDCLTEYAPDEVDPDEPVCKNCGSAMLAEMADKSVWVPRGELRFDTLSPFEVYLDPMIEELEDQPMIMVVQSFTPEQIYQKWGAEIEQDATSSQAELSTAHREGIASIGMNGGASPLGAQSDKEKRIVVYRTFIKYHKDYKKGAYLVMTAGGKLLERVPEYPWKTRSGQGKKFYPLVHYRFGTVGGRAWGYTPADDLMPKQYQLNKAESLFTLIMSRMANPVWLIPQNTNPSRITGEIGIQVEYTPVGSAAPQRIPGAEAPQSLVKYIEDIRNSFDELSGAFSAVRGRSLGTRTPVGTVQSLQERGFGRWATVFQMLEEGYEELARKSLEIWRQSSKTPRVMAIKNALGGYTFSELQAADWDDGIDVEVEAGSSRPHTQAEKMQAYMQMAQVGVLDFTDEAQKIKMLEDLGFVNMRPGVEEDQKQAYRENAEFMEWARQLKEQILTQPLTEADGLMAEAMSNHPIMVEPLVDDHAVHFLTHRRLCLSDEFRELPHQFKDIMFMHMLQHQADLPLSKINQLTMLNAQQAQQPGQGKPGSGPGGGSADAAPLKEMDGGESGQEEAA